MTSPDGRVPTTAYVGTSGPSGVSGVQDETEAQIRAAGRAPTDAAFGAGRNNMIANLFGGFVGGIAQFVSTLFSGIFGGGGGGGGGILDLIGGLLGIKNDVNQVVNVTVPSLQNQIDEISVGGVSASRAFFGTSGTWTKPTGTWSRHVIDVIGGGSGGTRPGGSGGGTIGAGGWVGGWAQEEFFDSDLPATLTVQVGLGGAGGVADGSFGSPGQQSQVVGWVAAGGGQLATATNGAGFGNKTITTIRGGTGGASIIAATAGTGHDYAAGGAGGTPNNSGNPGGNGNTPVPSTRAYPGTGGGGGAGKSGFQGVGGNGGNGGFPGGPGGGGGAKGDFGVNGNGGNGAGGGVWITSYK